MTLFIDRQYLNRMSHGLEQFKKLSENRWVCRCPICGDSKISSVKARGYFGVKEDRILYHCFNCDIGLSLGGLMKQVDPTLYREYVFESIKERRNLEGDTRPIKKESKFDAFRTAEKPKVLAQDPHLRDPRMTPIIKLPDGHPCKEYVKGREIPEKFHADIYYCEDFRGWVNSIIPDKFPFSPKPEPRLVIPYFDRERKMIAFVGRALDPESKPRYYTIKVKEEYPKIFGLDRLDYGKPVLCTEGAIDSMFLDNAIAVSGASYDSPILESIKPNLTIVGDNERRNPEVCGNIEKLLSRGFKVVLWRKGLPFKDINEAILKGYTKDDIMSIIKEDTVSGASGLIKYKVWKRF